MRARVAHLMSTLFPGEPGKGRREFARLIAAARANGLDLPTPPRLSSPLQTSLQEAGAPGPSAPPRDPPEPPPPHAKEGDVLGGPPYPHVREIGRGACSVVYEAEHLDLGRRAAIKIIAEAPEQGARFRREARTLSRLSHEGLVAVNDVGQAADGRLFCVMELLEGETLERLHARDKALGHRAALAVARRVLAALEVAHGAALVHRDIKPANLFLPRPPTAGSARPVPHAVKLLDFGLARGVDDPDGATPSAVGAEKPTGYVLYGTPEYMAPEQAAGAPLDARADLYALGCVLYEMITGSLPFTGPSSVAVLDAKIKGSPERPRSRAPAREIPPAVDALVMKALARHPSQRFQTATEMRLAVESALADPSRRSRARLAAASAVALVALLGAGAWASHAPKLRAAIPWLHRADATVAVAVAEAPADAPAVDAQAGPDGFDQGDDGDFVDDTPPPAPAAEPAAPVDEPAAAEKPRRRKHGPKGGAKVAKAKGPDATPGGKGDDDGNDKPRHKRKGKVAHAQ